MRRKVASFISVSSNLRDRRRSGVLRGKDRFSPFPGNVSRGVDSFPPPPEQHEPIRRIDRLEVARKLPIEMRGESRRRETSPCHVCRSEQPFEMGQDVGRPNRLDSRRSVRWRVIRSLRLAVRRVAPGRRQPLHDIAGQPRLPLTVSRASGRRALRERPRRRPRATGRDAPEGARREGLPRARRTPRRRVSRKAHEGAPREGARVRRR